MRAMQPSINSFLITKLHDISSLKYIEPILASLCKGLTLPKEFTLQIVMLYLLEYQAISNTPIQFGNHSNIHFIQFLIVIPLPFLANIRSSMLSKLNTYDPRQDLKLIRTYLVNFLSIALWRMSSILLHIRDFTQAHINT